MSYKTQIALVVSVVLSFALTTQAQNLLTNGDFESDPTPFPNITDAPASWTWRNANGVHQHFGYIPFGGAGIHLHSVDFENWLEQSVPRTIQLGDVLTFSAKVANIGNLADGGGRLEIQNAAGQVLAASANANTVPQANLQTGPIYFDLSTTLNVSSLTPAEQATIVGSQAVAVIHVLGNDPAPFGLDSLNVYYDNAVFTIVPEPASIVLLAWAGLPVLLRSRR
jgi:hypothetical protein